ncbi:MAG TPA: LysM domain-containing protein [Thermoanaerobaculia bacterium]|nr:LysM domain-containing protein [Thermoanaerobaculia bacterium]
MAATAVVAETPKQSSTPPRELHRAGEHWTAYNSPDPATYPAGAKTHEIKAGDTLWSLAQQYYGNAYLWPQLWEMNTWVTDAHWIYPGDVLLVSREGTESAAVPETTGSPTPAPAPAEEMPTAQMTPASPPIPLATEADLYCWGYIGDPNEPMPNRIRSFEDVEVTYQPGVLEQINTAATNDLVFIEGGSSTGLVAGETYLLVEPGEMIRHPRSGEAIGRHYDYSGQVRILCTEETRSRGVIVQACREIAVGARLKPLPQLPIPLARIPELPQFCDSPTGRQAGFIVGAKNSTTTIGLGTLVEINLGRDDQLQPGDFLTVFRENPLPGEPPLLLGEIGVLTTENRTATGRVVNMRRAMQIGDRVEAR